ncbi:PREDICTED: uncharacterized protein LOC104807095 [Tarenaya hassleriana]|uniref:uncharacterized protein LOC104807095 n=1 Tax=Tarenaya hassleriana TaxID=28532 RepID=UPI00053C8AAC|nr:PREDICTED: uncharacterized protein LOC104807095 [Tarenaya hassleriana]
MSRRKSVVATPEPTTALLRRSARLSFLKNRDDFQKPGKGRLLGSDSDSNSAADPIEGEEAAKKKNHRDIVSEVAMRLVYPLVGSSFGANSKKSRESNGSRDVFCSLRRSPRFSSRGCSNAEGEKSTQCSSSKPSSASLSRRNPVTASRASHGLNSSNKGSCTLRRSPVFSNGGDSWGQSSLDGKDLAINVCARCTTKSEEGIGDGSYTLRRSPRFSSGGGSVGQSSSDRKKLGKSVLARCNKKSEEGKGKHVPDSSHKICTRRRSCIRSQTKQILGACDEGIASVCPRENKRRKSTVSAQPNGYCREEKNAMSNLTFDSTGEFTGEKKREIVLGLHSRTSLASDRGTVRSLVKADEEQRTKSDIIDSRLEEDRLKMMNNKLDGESNCGPVQGWAKEQELALQKAYFTAKPSPNFWKKVSKLVPGKSAQECFDRVHSDLITPRQPQPRSRAKKVNLSPIPQFSLSASKLLKPTRPKSKMSGQRNRRRNHFAKKTIRHLLEKQCHVDQGHGLDLFSVLERSTESYVLSTPSDKRGSLRKILERSSSAQKKPCSRFTTTLTSPPVLKQIKNKAQHEKYIDQLHLREAKRKAESAKGCGKENIKPNDVQKSVRAVKDALILDVKDAIEKLKGVEADCSSSSSEFGYDRDEEEDEATGL